MSARIVTIAALALLSSFAHATAPLAPCQRLYSEVVFDGTVDYARVAAHPERPACARALAMATPPRARSAAIAFWADAYNLLTILAIADEPARWSPQQDGKALFRDRTFDIAGRTLTLDQIERDQIGPQTGDPRVEFLLSCGSRSCALLPSKLLSAELGESAPEAAIDAAMADGMRRWFARPDNLRVRRQAGVVEIGQLLQLDWHGGDFVRAGTPLASLVANVLEERDSEAARDLREGRLRLQFRPYDWRVNRLRRVHALP